ncbi:MAG TPA: hypothetical protein VK163_08705 [Opitutaceae bacterium]|nr:hypothetical protein [Opitutaceae bacterium]
MKHVQPAITALALLVAIAACCFAWREHARAQRAVLAAAEAESRSVMRFASAPAPDSPALEVVPVAPKGSPPPAEPSGRPQLGRRSGPPPDFSADPEIAPLLLKQRQRQAAARYAALFARLELTPELTAQLERLLADKQLSRFEAMGLARRQGLGRDEAHALANQADAESDNSIRALIGDAAFTQLEEYDRTYQQRTTVNSLSTQLSYSGQALSPGQQEKLIAVLAEHAVVDEQSFAPPGIPGSGSVFNRSSSAEEIEEFFENKAASDAEVINRVSTFLTPAQIEAVRRQQQDETDRLRITALRIDRMRRAQAASGGN